MPCAHFASLVKVDCRPAEIRPPKLIVIGPVFVTEPNINENALSDRQAISIE